MLTTTGNADGQRDSHREEDHDLKEHQDEARQRFQGVIDPQPDAAKDLGHVGLEAEVLYGGDPLRRRHGIEAVPPGLVEQHAFKIAAEQAKHEQSGQQNAEEFSQDELTPRYRLAHQRDGRSTFDFLTDRRGGGQGAEDRGQEHDGVVAQLLDHEMVFAKREIGDEGRGGQRGEPNDNQEPKHRLAYPLAEGRLSHRASLGPHPQEDGEEKDEEVNGELQLQQETVGLSGRFEIIPLDEEKSHDTRRREDEDWRADHAQGRDDPGQQRPVLPGRTEDEQEPGNGGQGLDQHKDQAPEQACDGKSHDLSSVVLRSGGVLSTASYELLRGVAREGSSR